MKLLLCCTSKIIKSCLQPTLCNLYSCICVLLIIIIRCMYLKRKLIILTIDEKVNIINEMTKNNKPKYEIAKQFNISLSTLPTILKNEDYVLYKYEND